MPTFRVLFYTFKVSKMKKQALKAAALLRILGRKHRASMLEGWQLAKLDKSAFSIKVMFEKASGEVVTRFADIDQMGYRKCKDGSWQITYFDQMRDGWRSFKAERFISLEVAGLEEVVSQTINMMAKSVAA
jgi:hypothetical protein